MPAPPFGRPAATEYAPYFERYIRLVRTDDLLGFMQDQVLQFTALIAPLGEEKGGFAYEPGKWTVKEVLGHVMDTERVFQYRALSIARTDPTPLPGFDQDMWTPNGGFSDCSLASLLEEWTLVRQANVAFLRNLPQAALKRSGRASDNPCSVRALAYIPPGHTVYHMNILKERYL